MTIKAVLFDLDGTLVDSNDFHVLAWRQAFADNGSVIGDRTIHEQIGKGADMLVPALLPGVGEDEAGALGEAHGKHFKALYLEKVQPFPQARALLRRVHEAGLKVILASSAKQSEIDHYVDLLDVRDIVSGTTSADDVAHSKPAPDIFATALNKVAPLGASEVMVVGDTPYDIEAARKCGIAAIGVRSGGFTDEKLREAVAVYDDVAALLADFENSPLSR